ncbi:MULTISPECIES: 50S ribosomal protein L21 [unclassified Olleya]|mgnify:CR=1 FL=1|jgi:large subunit ribosomal protein L21|uniref:50S ribosomal protein L21 n=1 Tax=unclassified Olleya TaxID=2615019 RepID=UPI0011AA0797|nr:MULTISPECIES: 50S ribosomal protein L21 [unclassified Olleya]TVZ47854.1 large subunit ribosomal protein L21 [Olleya sp. Hel_I_94]|tara:strand:- start:2415 stop:3074 length:660 start_codon:yes stop_codon:yes gene_type:complete
MYAIVEIAGHQFKVEKDQKVFVNRLATEEGEAVSFDNVLLIADGSNITVGAPAIGGAQVSAKVLKHLQGDKVIVFKKKRRKGYRKKNGHRQALTEIVIESIVASGAKPAAKAEKAAPKKETKKVEAKAAPKKAAKASGKADDLKKVEGIGPKIAETLVEAGIATFAELAKTDAAKISEIIAGVRGNHVTDTWPAQAQLAADGKWDELKKWQDELDGGKA